MSEPRACPTARSAAAETVWFALDGVGYEVGLSAVNAAALRALL